MNDLKERAANYLAQQFAQDIEFQNWIIEFIAQYPDDWQHQIDPLYPPEMPRPIHFTLGMKIRNGLREAGFTDDKFGMNLDDAYVEITNMAIKKIKGV